MLDSFVTLQARSQIFSWMIFLLPALVVTTRHGAGIIEVAVLLGVVVWGKRLWRQRNELFGQARWIVSAFAFGLASALMSSMWAGFQSRSIDNPVRELLAMAAIGLIVHAKPKADWFWYGLFAGTLGAAGIAFYQRFGLGLERAGGFHQIIMFGDISMAMALMALASTLRFKQTRLRFLPYIAFLSGFAASVLSGSRGGWISLFLLFIPLYLSGRRVKLSKLVQVSLVAMVLAISAYLVPQSGVSQRFEALSSDLHQYKLGNPNSSLGLRFETWKGAWKMFAEHPLLGVGRPNFNHGLNQLIQRKEVHPDTQIIYHAHNELLHALATEGLLGAAALIWLYGAPLVFFTRVLRRDNLARPYAMAGLLLVLSFAGFGLTQVLFAHHVGAAFYALTVSTLAGLCVMIQRTKS